MRCPGGRWWMKSASACAGAASGPLGCWQRERERQRQGCDRMGRAPSGSAGVRPPGLGCAADAWGQAAHAARQVNPSHAQRCWEPAGPQLESVSPRVVTTQGNALAKHSILSKDHAQSCLCPISARLQAVLSGCSPLPCPYTPRHRYAHVSRQQPASTENLISMQLYARLLALCAAKGVKQAAQHVVQAHLRRASGTWHCSLYAPGADSTSLAKPSPADGGPLPYRGGRTDGPASCEGPGWGSAASAYTATHWWVRQASP